MFSLKRSVNNSALFKMAYNWSSETRLRFYSQAAALWSCTEALRCFQVNFSFAVVEIFRRGRTNLHRLCRFTPRVGLRNPCWDTTIIFRCFTKKVSDKQLPKLQFHCHYLWDLNFNPNATSYSIFCSVPTLILTVSQLLAFNYNTENTCNHAAYTSLSQWVIIWYWHQLMCGGSCVSMHVCVWLRVPQLVPKII